MQPEWCNVACHLVPVTVVVVGHDGNPVKVLRKNRDVISSIDNHLAGRHGSGQKEILRLESGRQLLHEEGKVLLVRIWSLATVDLPALRVFPIKVQTVKSVLGDKLQSLGNKACSGTSTADQCAVLAAQGVVPATKGQKDLDALFFQG